MEPHDLQILQLVFEEKNRSVHIIRERTLKTTMWFAGGMFALTAWSLSTQDLAERAPGPVLAFVVVALVAVLQFLRLERRGFNGQLQRLALVETALQLYEKGRYHPDKALYPGDWKRSGSWMGKAGGYFASLYLFNVLSAVVAGGTQVLLLCDFL